MNQTKVENHRFASLDAMRAIAALLVVWQHFSETLIAIPGVAAQGTGFADVAHAVDFGRIGVIVFFLVSGYIIPNSLSTSSGNPIERFAIKRFFRLYPAYWVSMILFIGVGSYCMNRTYTPSQVLANATMLQTFFGEEHIQGLYWTLQIELIFYALCCVLHHFKLLTDSRLIFATCFVLLAVFGTLQIMAKRHHLDIPKELVYAPFLIGIMFLGSIYRRYHDAQQAGTARKSELYILVAAGIMCFSVPIINLLAYALLGTKLSDNPIRFGASHLLALALFVAGIGFLKKPPRFLAWVGVISYSVYLFHPVVMYSLKYVVESNAFLLSHPVHVSVYMAISLVICLYVSSLVYRFIESPAIDMGHRFTKKKPSSLSAG